jgi:uncharacterized protein YbcV (DUF1398 family)
MDPRQIAVARQCLEAADTGAMTFPRIVGTLIEAGFESYAIDLRRALAVYFLPSGEAVELPAHTVAGAVGAAFDAAAVKAAILEAQTLAPGYSYRGFCAKVMAAGCAGYIVSFPGRRAVYFGRTGEVHVEHFPQAG